MSIRVHFNDDDGLLRPYPVCDHCGQPIENEQGVAYLGGLDRYSNKTVEVEVLHQACDAATGRRRGWRPLQDLLVQMVNNGTGTKIGREALK